MRKKFIKWISLTMFISTLVLCGIAYISFFNIIKTNERKSALEVFTQLGSGVDSYDELNQEVLYIFENDYLHRAFFTDKMLFDLEKSQTEEQINQELRETLINVADVIDINVTDSTGKVIYSSNPNSLKLDFSQEGYEIYHPFFNGQTDDLYVFDYNGVSVYNANTQYIFLGMKRLFAEGMIQLVIDYNILEGYRILSSYTNYIKNIPSRPGKGLFIIDLDGNITMSNPEESILAIENKSEVLSKADGKMQTCTINDKKAMLYVIEHNGYYFGAYVYYKPIYIEAFIFTLIGILVLIVIGLITSCSIYFLTKHLILDDFNKTCSNVDAFINGDLNVDFNGGVTEEFKKLNKNYQTIADVIRKRKESFTEIVGLMGPKIEAYEYHHSINQLICSKNLLNLVCLDMETFKQNVKKRYMEAIANLDRPILYQEYIVKVGCTNRYYKVKRVIQVDMVHAFVEEIENPGSNVKLIEF